MLDRITATASNEKQSRSICTEMHRIGKGLIKQGESVIFSARAATRADWQNARYHSQISQISEHIKGDLADKEDAKRILVSAFKMDTQNDPALREEWAKLGDVRMGRGLRGEVVVLGTQTRTFTVKLAAAFIVWLDAFAAEHQIVFKAGKQWEDYQ